MKLLAVVTFPGWRLRSYNERLHWAVRRKANQPLYRHHEFMMGEDCALVTEPHKRRTVEITRYGPREMDMDNLAASVKPALDLIKCKKVNGYVVPGYIFDDDPSHCLLKVKQEKGDYGVRVRVYG